MKTSVSFLALTMVAVMGSLACSSSSGGGDTTKDGSTSDTSALPGTDGGGPDGAKTDGAKTDSASTDGTPGSDASSGSNTVGKPCTDDATCDTSGDGLNACSNSFFSSGTLFPTPVCVASDCDPGDGTTIEDCDGGLGVCLDDGSGGGLCLPACAFADDAAAPTGCSGKDVCNVFGWGKDASGKLGGVGYCFGGCNADADCTGGDKCQKESGLCVKALNTYTKHLGDPCTDADSTSPAKCECLYLTSTNKGYCSQYCKVGDAATACPSGYTCSPALPKTDDSDGSALFSKDPVGMAGSCLKTCAADAECTSLNSTCSDTASGKVCYPKS